MRITKKHVLSFAFLSLFSLAQVILFFPTQVSAQASNLVSGQEGLNEVGRVFGDTGSGAQDIRYIIARVINLILGFLGVIFFILTIFAGFKYMTAAGNEEEVKKSLSLLKNAVIGLLIVLISWTITRYVLISLGGAVNNTAGYQNYRVYP